MPKISGHGGFCVLVEEDLNVRFENAGYEADVSAVIDDVTDSGSAGSAQGLAIISKVNGLVLEAVDTSESTFALALGVTEGATVTIWCKRGAALTGDLFTGLIVSSVHTSNPQQGARRVRITCEYGRLQRNQAMPDLD